MTYFSLVLSLKIGCLPELGTQNLLTTQFCSLKVQTFQSNFSKLC